MGRLIYSIMISLDGYIEGADRNLDWVMIDEELHRFVNQQENGIGAHLYGRRTYEIMTAYWPTAELDPQLPDFLAEYARIWVNMPKYVFSKTLQQVEGNATLIQDHSVDEIRKLKEQPGKDMEIGGAALAASVIPLGLVDEYQIYIHPVVLGSGTPMFPLSKVVIPLHLHETQVFHSGVVFLRYQTIQ